MWLVVARGGCRRGDEWFRTAMRECDPAPPTPKDPSPPTPQPPPPSCNMNVTFTLGMYVYTVRALCVRECMHARVFVCTLTHSMLQEPQMGISVVMTSDWPAIESLPSVTLLSVVRSLYNYHCTQRHTQTQSQSNVCNPTIKVFSRHCDRRLQ